MTLAGVTVAIDDALLVGLCGAEAAALEGAIRQALAVAYEALVTEAVDWTHFAVGMVLDGATGIG